MSGMTSAVLVYEIASATEASSRALVCAAGLRADRPGRFVRDLRPGKVTPGALARLSSGARTLRNISAVATLAARVLLYASLSACGVAECETRA